MRLEGVNRKHGNVANQQECYDLASRLNAVVLGQVDSTARNVRDEQQLDDDLDDGDDSGDHDEQVGFAFHGVQRTGNHAERGVDKQTEGGDAKQDVVQVALLLAAELEVLDAGVGGEGKLRLSPQNSIVA